MTTRSITDRLDGPAFGGDDNPEQWDEPVWNGRSRRIPLNHTPEAVPLPDPAHRAGRRPAPHHPHGPRRSLNVPTPPHDSTEGPLTCPLCATRTNDPPTR
ncbi:hypothetical protein STANM337S_07217 [Streptomyces tanashiensis]